LKIIDTRELTNNPSKSVPWKVKKAHEHSIRDISWNPLVEYWIATSSDDGCIKVWDIRYNSGEAARTLQQHNNVVNCVRWSESHCELLISGSDDRSMKLWNLRAPMCSPHYLLYSHLYAHPVVGCGYSPFRPMQFFGLSSGGELQCVELTDHFVADFVPHRFTERSFAKKQKQQQQEREKKEEEEEEKKLDDDEEDHEEDVAVDAMDEEEERRDFIAARDIELMIYVRDMASAHASIPELAHKQWRRGNKESAQDLLNLVSTVGFQSTLAKYHKQYAFNEMLNKIAPFYHPNAVILSAANPRHVSQCEEMKLRMFIRKVLAKREWKKLLIMKDKIFKHLLEMSVANESDNEKEKENQEEQEEQEEQKQKHKKKKKKEKEKEENSNIMVECIELLRAYCLLDAIKWCMRCNDVYHEHQKYHLMVPIAINLLYPTIYHFADRSIVKSPDPTLLRKSAHILHTKLSDYEFMKWQLNLLLHVYQCMQNPQYAANGLVATNVIQIWKEAQKQQKQQQQSQSQQHGQQQGTENANGRRSVVLNIDENLKKNYSNITQCAYRVYFEALLYEGYCDSFFIECTRLSHQNKGYEISYIITDMMDNEGYTELQSYLEHKHSVSEHAESVMRDCCDAVICIVNICENCPELPKCLRNNLPKYLQKFQLKLHHLLQANPQNTAYKQFGKELIKRIKHIQDNKLNTQYFFRNEIHGLETMVHAFCID